MVHVVLKIPPEVESLYGLGRQATKLYSQFPIGFHFDNFLLKTLKLG